MSTAVEHGRRTPLYRGRFAPSPTGDLHLGSLYTATASYLDARANGGRWLLRIDDLDAPRVVPGAADRILSTLERFGFEWDEEPSYQSARTAEYLASLAMLERRGLLYPCSCSRAQLAADEPYPGLCREGTLTKQGPTALRLRVDAGIVQFTDRVQGIFRQDVAAAVGDMVLQRRDSLITYVLAVVVDDAALGISRVVRGADLLDNTPRQIYLQRLLDFPTPEYAHVPVLLEPNGQKLAKSARSIPLEAKEAVSQLLSVFQLLNLEPPGLLHGATISELWHWAIGQWASSPLPRGLGLRIPPVSGSAGRPVNRQPQV